MNNFFPEQQANSSKPKRPDSARGDKEFNIKTNSIKNETQKLLKEKRELNKDSKSQENQSKIEKEIKKATNFVDATRSPGLDLLFTKFDQKVITGEESEEPQSIK